MVDDPAVFKQAGAANEADSFGLVQLNVSPVRRVKSRMAEHRMRVPVGGKMARDLNLSLHIANIFVIADSHNKRALSSRPGLGVCLTEGLKDPIMKAFLEHRPGQMKDPIQTDHPRGSNVEIFFVEQQVAQFLYLSC